LKATQTINPYPEKYHQLTLLFKKQFLQQIIKGTKTQTRRLKKPQLTIGKTYPLRKNYQTNLPHSIKIIDIYPQILGEITDEDLQREGFEDNDAFKDMWREIYGSYDPAEYIWVIEFEYIGVTDTFKTNLKSS